MINTNLRYFLAVFWAIMLTGCGDKAVLIAQESTVEEGQTAQQWIAGIAGPQGKASWSSFQPEGQPRYLHMVTAEVTRPTNKEDRKANIKWIVNLGTGYTQIYSVEIDRKPVNLVTGLVNLSMFAFEDIKPIGGRFHGNFDVGKALNVAFGISESKNNKWIFRNILSTTTNPQMLGSFGDEGLLEVKLVHRFKQKGINKILLVTSATGIDEEKRPSDCHACSALISFVVFRSEKGAWVVEDKESALGLDGDSGQINKVEPVAFGRENVGFRTLNEYMGQGFGDINANYYGFTGSTFKKVLGINLGSGDGSGFSSKIYRENKVSFEFIGSEKKEWMDIETIRTGNYVPSDIKMTEVDNYMGTKIYVFDGDKYAPAPRH